MIRNQIEDIVNSMTSNAGAAPGFLFGTANELNLLADDKQFPVVFMYTLKPAQLSYTLSNSIDDKYSIYLEFLYLTRFDQFTSQNETYITQALNMAKEFMIRLKDYRPDGEKRFFKVKRGNSGKSMPVYNKFDANTTGVNLTLDLQTMYSEKICF